MVFIVFFFSSCFPIFAYHGTSSTSSRSHSCSIVQSTSIFHRINSYIFCGVKYFYFFLLFTSIFRLFVSHITLCFYNITFSTLTLPTWSIFPRFCPHSYLKIAISFHDYRSKSNIFKPKQLYQTTTTHPLPEAIKPTCVTQALKNVAWRTAMSDELTALFCNGSWKLVPLSGSQNVVSCKWVFRIKWNLDGILSKYKAHLVAKGFHQWLGVDFHETFSHVVKPVTIRIILNLALFHGWPLC